MGYMFNEEEMKYLHVMNGEYIIDEKAPEDLKNILLEKLETLSRQLTEEYDAANR